MAEAQKDTATPSARGSYKRQPLKQFVLLNLCSEVEEAVGARKEAVRKTGGSDVGRGGGVV